MPAPIGSVGRPGRARRLRGRRADGPAAPPPPEQPEAAPRAEAAAPIPSPELRPEDAPPALSAQLMGQSGPAEGAAQANSARRAASAYLEVEWSGPRDRRTRRGRIAKTEV